MGYMSAIVFFFFFFWLIRLRREGHVLCTYYLLLLLFESYGSAAYRCGSIILPLLYGISTKSSFSSLHFLLNIHIRVAIHRSKLDQFKALNLSHKPSKTTEYNMLGPSCLH